MNVRSLLSASISFLTVAAITSAFAQTPSWAVSRTHKSYPPAEYILGVGEGKGEKANENAKRLAQSDIATQVRMEVQREIKNIQQMYGLNPNQESYADFKIKSASVADEELPDAAIAETAVDPSTGTTYALAVLNKEKFSASIAAALTSGWDRVRELQHAAEISFGQGKLTEAIHNIIEARSGVMDLLPKQALYNALAHTPFHGDPSLSPSAFTSSVREKLSSIRVEKLGGDKQKGKIGEKFPEPFIIRVTAREDNTSVPVVGVAIVFLNLAGEEFGEALTDAKGTASCSIRVRGGIGRRLRARISLPFLGKEFYSDVNFSSAVFDCASLDADVAFSVKIDGRSAAVNDALRSVVVDAVTRAGYHTVDMSRFMLRGEFQSMSPTVVEGDDGKLYNISSEVTILLIDKDSNRTLGSVRSKSQGSAKTEAGALEKSLRAVKFDGPELVSLLEKAKN